MESFFNQSVSLHIGIRNVSNYQNTFLGVNARNNDYNNTAWTLCLKIFRETHYGIITSLVSWNVVIIGSGNGLSPIRRHPLLEPELTRRQSDRYWQTSVKLQSKHKMFSAYKIINPCLTDADTRKIEWNDVNCIVNFVCEIVAILSGKIHVHPFLLVADHVVPQFNVILVLNMKFCTILIAAAVCIYCFSAQRLAMPNSLYIYIYLFILYICVLYRYFSFWQTHVTCGHRELILFIGSLNDKIMIGSFIIKHN